jgi:hypothetical protein
MDGSFSGFLLTSYSSDLELKSSRQNIRHNKSLFSLDKGLGKGKPKKNEKLLDHNCSSETIQTKIWFTIHSSKGWVERLLTSLGCTPATQQDTVLGS